MNFVTRAKVYFSDSWKIGVLVSFLFGMPWVIFYPESLFEVLFLTVIVVFLALIFDYVRAIHKVALVDNRNLRGLHAMYEELRQDNYASKQAVEQSVTEIEKHVSELKDNSKLEGLVQDNTSQIQAAMTYIVQRLEGNGVINVETLPDYDPTL